MTIRKWVITIYVAAYCVCSATHIMGEEAAGPVDTLAARADVDVYRAAAVLKWETEITRLEARDQSEPHPADGILFIGSSSIRRWEKIADDMAPYHSIQRGYGGAKWSDVAVFAERLISPHSFRAVVFFVGNDISGNDDDKSPEEVVRLFAYVVQRVREHNRQAPVFFVAVTPTPARFAAWPDIQAANKAVRAVCQRSDHTYYIGTESIFLGASGRPRPELFVEDELHLNRAGYVRWAAAIKTHLDSVLGGTN